MKGAVNAGNNVPASKRLRLSGSDKIALAHASCLNSSAAASAAASSPCCLSGCTRSAFRLSAALRRAGASLVLHGALLSVQARPITCLHNTEAAAASSRLCNSNVSSQKNSSQTIKEQPRVQIATRTAYKHSLNRSLWRFSPHRVWCRGPGSQMHQPLPCRPKLVWCARQVVPALLKGTCYKPTRVTGRR